MPAIVRVKRRIDEEPLNAFVLNGKKRRLDESDGAVGGQGDEKDEISTVLKFAGTLKEADNTATTQFARRLSKNEAKDLVQTKSARKASNYLERARQEIRQNAQENRFRVVNCMRTVLPEENDKAAGGADSAATATNENKDIAAKSITIVDIEKNPNETDTSNLRSESSLEQISTQSPADSDSGYVYDLYLPDDDIEAQNADLMDDNYLRAFGINDIIFEDAYNDPHDDEDYDSEDSNREDYFTNDYPDEDDELHSANEYDVDDEDSDLRDMRHAVENFVFGDDDDSKETNSEQDYYDGFSSEDEEACYAFKDPYVQCVNIDDKNIEPDVDTVDVQDFEEAYLRYRELSENRRIDHQTNILKDHADPMYDGDEFNDSELYHSADEQE